MKSSIVNRTICLFLCFLAIMQFLCSCQIARRMGLYEEKTYHEYFRIRLENYEIVYFERDFVLILKEQMPGDIRNVVKEKAEQQSSNKLKIDISIDTIPCEISLLKGFGRYVKIFDNQIPLGDGNESIILIEHHSIQGCFECPLELKYALNNYIQSSTDNGYENTLLSVLASLCCHCPENLQLP